MCVLALIQVKIGVKQESNCVANPDKPFKMSFTGLAYSDCQTHTFHTSAPLCWRNAQVQVLLVDGTTVNHLDSGRRTALHIAAAGGHVAVVRVLLAYPGAHRDSVTSSGAFNPSLPVSSHMSPA